MIQQQLHVLIGITKIRYLIGLIKFYKRHEEEHSVFLEEKAEKVKMQTKPEGSHSLLAPNTQHPLLLEREEIREKGYHGKSRQALGKAPVSLTKLPSFTSAKGFKFGDKTVVGKISSLI
jgi:hypothetical protein